MQKNYNPLNTVGRVCNVMENSTMVPENIEMNAVLLVLLQKNL